MNYVTRILVWVVLASVAIFMVYIWLPEWIKVTGVFLGYLSILLVYKTSVPKEPIRDILLLMIFMSVTTLSYVALLLACFYVPFINQCSERAKNSLLLANILFVGLPIVVLYIFDRIPRFLKNSMRK